MILNNKNKSGTIIIAHRAFGKTSLKDIDELIPELIRNDIGGIEIDVQMGKGGIPIVVHDYLFDRERDYPLLSDILKTINDRIRTEIEIKGYEKDLVLAILEVVQDLKIKNYEITSAEPPIVSLLANNGRSIQKGIMIKNSMFEDWMPTTHKNRLIIGYLKLTGANVLHLNLEDYNLKLVQSLRKLKIKTHTLLNKPTRLDINRIHNLNIDFCSIVQMKDRGLILSNK